jgi:hypothetical protein
VRRRPDRIEDIAGVNDEVNVSLQNGIHSPCVRLLYVNLPLVASRPRTQPRVPGIPQVRVRDVSYADYLPTPFSLYSLTSQP